LIAGEELHRLEPGEDGKKTGAFERIGHGNTIPVLPRPEVPWRMDSISPTVPPQLAQLNQMVHQARPAYDSIDPSEAIVLDEARAETSLGNEQLMQQYYNFYLNHFLAFLSFQNRFLDKQKEQEGTTPHGSEPPEADDRDRDGRGIFPKDFSSFPPRLPPR